MNQETLDKVQLKESALNLLDAAAGESSWNNMQEQYPALATRLEQAIRAGVSSDEIFRRLRANHGAEFCKWCRTVARYLESVVS